MIEHVSNQAGPCLVYKALNLVNHKIYVGATDRGLRNRQIRHIWNAKNGRPGKFYNAIRKYGENNFWFTTLALCDNYWEALAEEREFIKALKPEYNLTEGGGGVKGYKFSLESRKKMSDAKRGKPGHITHAKSIKCLTDGKEFISLTAAAKYYGVTKSTISKNCKKLFKSRKGLEFEFITIGDRNV